MTSRFDLPGLAAALGRGFLRMIGFRSRTLVGGVHVMERVGGPRHLLLVHGIGADMGHWAATCFYLGRRHTIRLLDLPGHGASAELEGADLDGLNAVLVDAVRELPPSVMVGNSLGGAVVLKLAVQLPGHVEGLFLISPAGPPMVEAEFNETLGQFDIQTLTQARGFLRRLCANFPYNGAFVAPFVVSTFRRPGLRRIRAMLRADGAITADEARRLAIPVHLTWGALDGVLPVSLRDWLVANIPALQRADPADEAVEAHSPQVERPASVARRISAFVEAEGAILAAPVRPDALPPGR